MIIEVSGMGREGPGQNTRNVNTYGVGGRRHAEQELTKEVGRKQGELKPGEQSVSWRE